MKDYFGREEMRIGNEDEDPTERRWDEGERKKMRRKKEEKREAKEREKEWKVKIFF